MRAPLHVGVVAHEMERESTGVGRYLSGLLGGLAEQSTAWRWTLFLRGRPFDHPLWRHPAFEAVFSGSAAHPILWEQVLLPARLPRHGLDALFSPAYSLPPQLPGRGVPAVVTLHDLSFEELPGEFGWRERWRRRLLARRAGHAAARVLVDTRRMAEEVRRRYGVERRRLGVVPLAVEPRFHPEPLPGEEAALAARGITPPYLLFVGSLFPRRNIPLLLEVFAALAREREDLRLVLAGADRLCRPGELRRRLAAPDLAGRVLALGYAPEELLPALYRHAEASFYLSSYEGFGIPPLESLACGTPAVVGPGLALDELWPAYPYRSPRLEREPVLALTRRLLDRPRERREVARRAAEVLASHTWRHAAEMLMAEIRRAVESR